MLVVSISSRHGTDFEVDGFQPIRIAISYSIRRATVFSDKILAWFVVYTPPDSSRTLMRAVPFLFASNEFSLNC
jgi:hypothetical protein